MTSSSAEHEQTGCKQSKTILVSTHLEIHTDSETLLDVVDAGSSALRPRISERALSLRITDLISEAFPLPLSSDNDPPEISSEDSYTMDEVATRSDSPLPPAYIPLQQPPRYNRSGSLVSQEVCMCSSYRRHMLTSCSIPGRPTSRLILSADKVRSTFSDLFYPCLSIQHSLRSHASVSCSPIR